MSITDTEKAAAARKSLEYVKDGMIVGLGSGSTATFAIQFLGGFKNEKYKPLFLKATTDSSYTVAGRGLEAQAPAPAPIHASRTGSSRSGRPACRARAPAR